MEEVSENIKNKADSISDNTFGKKILNKSNGYVNGAIVGGVIGILGAVIFKKKIVFWGVICAIGGGYTGFKLAEVLETKVEFTNYEKTDD